MSARIAGKAGRRLATLSLLVSLGCAGGAPPPEDRFYRLAPELAAPASSAEPVLAGVLRVDPPQGDALTGERAILWTPGEASPRVERHRYHFWVEPPPTAIASALVESLRRARIARSVVLPDVRVEADYRLTGRLERFERVLGEADPAVHVVLRLALHDAGGGGVLWRGRFEERRRAAGDSVGEAVVAFEAALQAILERVVRKLRDAAPRRESPEAEAMLAPRP